MSDIDKSNAQCLLDPLELLLHIFAQTEIQCAQRFIQ